VTWGIVYPVVLLPDDADSWPEERRRFVLVHEMAHVKRLDALTQLAGQLALALFWFDPLMWVANRRMQLEREHACDDYVLRHGTAPSKYAD
jgi:bla regulator protein blaR1